MTSDWKIEFHSGIPAYKQIVHRVQSVIAQGGLKEGDQLPTIRAMHLQLKVNPNTVAKAYRELEVLGLISTAQGSGCFVTSFAPVPVISKEAKLERLRELTDRFTAEAQCSGIRFHELIEYLNRRKAHV